MDPFIEACGRWEDFHAKLISGIEGALSTIVPPRYFVGIGERYHVDLRETFIEIREVEDQRIVTSIEVLSPTNKRNGTEGWKLYARKRQACLEDDSISQVEIDLLRGGRRYPMRDPWPSSPYYILLKRRGHGHTCQVWPAHSVRALPRIPIPLADPDPDVEVAMQQLVDAVYERSRYSRLLDYTRPCRPALNAGEAECLSSPAQAP
jgi:hypothetical protein